MAKGDKRTRKGKIANGSYGKSRPRDEAKIKAKKKAEQKAKSKK